ncbi:glycogenin [Lathyrus oleraceus]|uniref:Glycogenin n=1 Tax=Pisum sativum TaxID=3888 RepID=A0A9D5AY03_PEA|nr:glycogenin [Pisum sativum]
MHESLAIVTLWFALVPAIILVEFLNMYFNDKYKRIPNVYNLVLAMLWSHLEKVKVVHYCAAGSKPYYM